YLESSQDEEVIYRLAEIFRLKGDYSNACKIMQDYGEGVKKSLFLLQIASDRGEKSTQCDLLEKLYKDTGDIEYLYRLFVIEPGYTEDYDSVREEIVKAFILKDDEKIIELIGKLVDSGSISDLNILFDFFRDREKEYALTIAEAIFESTPNQFNFERYAGILFEVGDIKTLKKTIARRKKNVPDEMFLKQNYSLLLSMNMYDLLISMITSTHNYRKDPFLYRSLLNVYRNSMNYSGYFDELLKLNNLGIFTEQDVMSYVKSVIRSDSRWAESLCGHSLFSELSASDKALGYHYAGHYLKALQTLAGMDEHGISVFMSNVRNRKEYVRYIKINPKMQRILPFFIDLLDSRLLEDLEKIEKDYLYIKALKRLFEIGEISFKKARELFNTRIDLKEINDKIYKDKLNVMSGPVYSGEDEWRRFSDLSYYIADGTYDELDKAVAEFAAEIFFRRGEFRKTMTLYARFSLQADFLYFASDMLLGNDISSIIKSSSDWRLLELYRLQKTLPEESLHDEVLRFYSDSTSGEKESENRQPEN
ncbi:MAG: hypothetical protein ACOCWO_03525, partial [Candidatus Muiribacteriaceae bacterium]